MIIKANGKYSRHIALFAYLLQVDVHVAFSGDVLTHDLKEYYKRTSLVVRRESNYDLPSYILENMHIPEVETSEDSKDLNCDCDCIADCEDAFFELIKEIIDLTDDALFESTITHFVKRPVNEAELVFHANNNTRRGITSFMWVCILLTCNETYNMNYRRMFLQGLGEVPKSINTRIAVIFCGHVRHNKLSTHLPVINSPHTDIFVHTWTDHGYKNGKRLIQKCWLDPNSEAVSEDYIRTKYKPIKMMVEDNMLEKFSFADKISPIFVYAGQAKDDPSRYINSQLYSIKRAYEMVCDYEKEMGFKYDAVIRFRFDFAIANFDWTGILTDIKNSNTIYFPHGACNAHKHPGGGGGCLDCDKDIEHERHTNDICDLWFYGHRDVVGRACLMYDNAFDMISEHHLRNIQQMAEDGKYTEHNGYVYINSTNDIEHKYVCLYPERILRETLSGIWCKSSKRICGRI